MQIKTRFCEEKLYYLARFWYEKVLMLARF